MFRSCIICSTVSSPDLQLQYCAACQSASYCSRACQRKDWKKQHKQICKLLNVGHGDMQVRNDIHTSQSIQLQEYFEEDNQRLREDLKRFFKLFTESTKDGSRAAAREMKKIAKREAKGHQKFLLLHSLYLLVHSDSEMLSWPNSPLLVLLQFVDPNMLPGHEHEPLREGENRVTPLHLLADLADPSDCATHENQLILAKQLIEHGANVNAVSIPDCVTPLHKACYVGNVTNLDFVEYLLEVGADPNAKCHQGRTPLMFTPDAAPGAAKFLLNWPTTDVNIFYYRSGESFLVRVRSIFTIFSYNTAFPDNPDLVEHKLLLQ
jgi:hypothetical protein